MNDLMVEARIWLTIICSHVSLTTNMTNVPIMQAQMVACLMDNIPLNVGHFVLSNI